MTFSVSFNLPFSQALAAARRRGALLPEDYYDLPREYRRYAFTVSRLAGLAQIEQVQRSLTEALATGKTFADWRRDVPPSALSLPKAHLELIFRQHAQTGYMSGHYRAMKANAQRRPFWMYSAINDERTRPAHRAMSGYIAHHTDPVWEKWFPPCGFNCRCTVISLTADQARARGFPMADRGVEPDPGFAGVPTDGGERARRYLEQLLTRYGAELTRAYERALEALLKPDWLNRPQLAAARAGLAAAIRRNPKFVALTPGEYFALFRYTGNDYKEINRRLRLDLDALKLRPIQLGIIQAAASGIRKLENVALEREVYRGLRLRRSDFERFERELQPGSVIAASGFMSASLSRAEALKFAFATTGKPYQVLFEIQTRRGMNLEQVSTLESELEALFAPGTRFVVVRAQRVGNVLIVRVRDSSGRPTIGLST